MSKTINQDNLNATLRMLNKMGEANLEQLKNTNHEQAEQVEKLGILLSNEDFCKQFVTSPDKQTAVQLFADHGLVLTEEDVTVLANQIRSIVQKLMDNDGSLSEADLEQIAGGFSVGGSLMGTIVGTLIGAVIGSICCPGLGTAAGVAAAIGIAGALGLGFALD